MSLAGYITQGIAYTVLMTQQWQATAESLLGTGIVRKQSLSGGDFAESYQAWLDDGRQCFIKTHKNPPSGFFTTEAAGLTWLRESGHVNVPEVLAVSDTPPLLALEWIDIGRANASTETAFGEALARLHAEPFSCFGRPDQATTGSQAMPNTPCDTWVEFYAERRLLPLVKKASDYGALSKNCLRKIERIAERLEEFGAASEPPRLLHGDLWAGNRVVDSQGASWLIDPAAHGGHREFDLAMMQLFGGYGQACFDAYQQCFPLESGWQHRIALHQLAPLAVHAIKFGGSYAHSTEAAASQFV